MCHEYGMRWWRSEAKEPKREKAQTEAAKPDLMALFAPQAVQAAPLADAEPVKEKQVEEKELASAK